MRFTAVFIYTSNSNQFSRQARQGKPKYHIQTSLPQNLCLPNYPTKIMDIFFNLGVLGGLGG
jgi:hypothetical protein